MARWSQQVGFRINNATRLSFGGLFLLNAEYAPRDVRVHRIPFSSFLTEKYIRLFQITPQHTYHIKLVIKHVNVLSSQIVIYD